ncbi:transposase InsO family protein [Chitinivorax tropicus]|uniref:Transposase InsO family protein n=1 Tax=Chitinivorax tropicus TaxID=714531 RepID=A0A840MKR5_9PROT|nr:transposase InsO family protein [Chitinivorax tropicus]
MSASVRACAEAGLQIRRRKRKKVPAADRHPLARPLAANQVWSMDLVFDRTAEGRAIKSLTVVDATHEAVAIVPERAMSGVHLTRVLGQLAQTRGLPKAGSTTARSPAVAPCSPRHMLVVFSSSSSSRVSPIRTPTSNRSTGVSGMSA